jgi:hypothetical protein
MLPASGRSTANKAAAPFGAVFKHLLFIEMNFRHLARSMFKPTIQNPKAMSRPLRARSQPWSTHKSTQSNPISGLKVAHKNHQPDPNTTW